MTQEPTIFPLAEAVRAAYRAGEDDEAMEPLVRVDAAGQPIGRIQDGDYVIFYNIRGEREVELTTAFVGTEFPHFSRSPMAVHFATMIEYHPDLDVQVAFPPLARFDGTLCDAVSRAGLRQVKVVESEKAIHVSFFLNGKIQSAFPGEERVVIHSPRPAAHADMPPDMSAAAVHLVHEPYGILRRDAVVLLVFQGIVDRVERRLGHDVGITVHIIEEIRGIDVEGKTMTLPAVQLESPAFGPGENYVVGFVTDQ